MLGGLTSCYLTFIDNSIPTSSMCQTMENITTIELNKRPWVVAHRGYRAKYPENTLASFEAAIAVEADMIELDVCLTLDRIPVVIHDKTLERTTTGKGLVSAHTLSELKTLDAGSWFGAEFKGEAIPTLEELLLKIKGRITVNIEIKPESFEEPSPPDAIEVQICEMVEKLEMADSVLISSFEHSFFARIQCWYREQNKSTVIRTAPLQEAPLADNLAAALCQRHSTYSYHPDECLVTPELIQHLHTDGFRIFPYTINDEKRMEQLIKWGVSGIISDEPEILWEVIRRLQI
jgi:glycerophosphoryl diester phosphodiesterase